MGFIVWHVEAEDANVILIGLDDGAFVAGWMYASKGTKVKHRRVLYWLKSYDMRLDEAMRRLPKYTREIFKAIETKQMEAI